MLTNKLIFFVYSFSYLFLLYNPKFDIFCILYFIYFILRADFQIGFITFFLDQKSFISLLSFLFYLSSFFSFFPFVSLIYFISLIFQGLFLPFFNSIRALYIIKSKYKTLTSILIDSGIINNTGTRFDLGVIFVDKDLQLRIYGLKIVNLFYFIKKRDELLISVKLY